jgi:thymidylate synthase
MMDPRFFKDFKDAMTSLTHDVVHWGSDVDPGHWQGYSTKGQPSLVTKELMNVIFAVPCDRPEHVDDYLDTIAEEIEPNRAWADEHFQERVGHVARNPDPSYERWPWWNGQEVSKQAGEKFTHTYSERFWPRDAWIKENGKYAYGPYAGIRYQAGDLEDLTFLLRREKYTRQAYLPIFFPEDTGAIHQGRIPCTLGYHFMVRPKVEPHTGERYDQLHCWYFIRSCDVVRHMRDDVYLAVRLMLWVLEQCWTPGEVEMGTLTMVIPSLHIHMGDIHRVKTRG